ncbi:hypothetical protein DFJ74DRAFT_122286 [Hyaloraphidium curvatum]|nr:hypothetical protein DFJ74DRAFT_122286 [Hyaloraphidium curvatum]
MDHAIPAGDGLATLGPADFLAVFPRPPAPDARLPRGLLPPTADPALPAREERPLTPESMLAALGKFPLQRAQLALQFDVLKLTGGYKLPWLHHFVFCTANVAVFCLIFPFNDGTFGSRNLATGAAAVFFNAFSYTVVHFLSGSWRPAGDKANNPLDGHSAADLVRWAQLVDAAGGATEVERKLETGPESSLLLAHHPEDPLCPCSKKECVGVIPETNAMLAFVTKLVVSILGPLVSWSVLGPWTIYITFASRTWSTPWAAFLAVAALLLHLLYCITLASLSTGTYVPYDFEVQNRLRRRTMSIALSDLVNRHEANWKGGESASTPPPAGEPYTWLHSWLVSDWQIHRIISDGIRRVWTFGVLIQVGTIIISVIGASCVPAWIISAMILITFGFLSSLYAVAVQNHHIDGTAALYLAAADRISLLVLRPAPAGTDRELVAHHATVLRTYADPTRYRARFLGFVVTFGAIRTLLLAVFTVAVGLVGLLRGGGVTVTLQSVCPG